MRFLLLAKGRNRGSILKVHQTDFSTGNVYRNIMEVALPMIMAQLLNLLYNVVDRMYIGRIPDKKKPGMLLPRKEKVTTA